MKFDMYCQLIVVLLFICVIGILETIKLIHRKLQLLVHDKYKQGSNWVLEMCVLD